MSPPIFSLDTETTGKDFRHGVKPFMVTTCDQAGDIRYWEWHVNPVTREPVVPPGDLDEIRAMLAGAETVVLQNPKFDATALHYAGITEFPWTKVRDTLLAGHLLASNRPKDLNSLSVQYLGHNPGQTEADLGTEVNAARRWVRTNRPTWRIAREGMSELPSASGSTSLWLNDMWLPRAVATAAGYAPDHHWHHVLRRYANSDSEVTMALWPVMEAEIRRRGLWRIYEERLKVLKIAFDMEMRGLTASKTQLAKQRAEYREESDRAARVCVGIAKRAGHDLTLPKAGVNNSLRDFMLGPLGLEPQYSAKSKTGNPTFDRAAIDHYLGTLPQNSVAYTFVRNLKNKRLRDTALQYMDSYERFWVPMYRPTETHAGLLTYCINHPHDQTAKAALADYLEEHGSDPDGLLDWYRLHPQLNPTGTDTLRWSSQDPNEQNISKKEGFNLRYIFGPPPGWEWWSMDAKNIELRIPFYKCGQQELIDLFERPDDPPYYGSNHLANFHAVYPDVWAEVEKEVGFEKVGPTCKKRFASTWYQWCKNGGFAKQYGGQRVKVDSTFRRAGAFDLLDAKFSKLAALNREQIRLANKYGYVETMPDKSVDPARGYPLLVTRTDRGRALETVPLSYYVQGTAMWWMMKAMIRVQDLFDRWTRQGFNAHIVIQIHDEMVFALPKRAHPKTDPANSNLVRAHEIRRTMELSGDDIGIPTPVSVEYHETSWGEGLSL